MPESSIRRLLRNPERRGWWRWFLPLAAVCLAWTFATPLFASPDEQAHLDKAGALLRGQLAGPQVPTAVGNVVQVRVPRALDDLGKRASCFWHKENVTARCAVRPPRRSGSVKVGIFAGKYPPTYYLLVGLPSRFWISDRALYLMRVLSALIGSAFLASAFMSAQRLGRWAVLGVAAAVTPMAIYLTSVLNPSGLEITSGVALWASVVALARARAIDTRLVVRATIAWVACVDTRSLTVAMVGFALVALPLMADASRRRELLATPARRLCCALVVLAGAASVLWTVTLGRFTRAAFLPHISFTFLAGVQRTWQLFRQSVAEFGLLEVRVMLAVFVFLAMWLIMMVVGLRVSRPRDSLIIIGLAVVSILFPIFVSMAQPVPILTAWQGRYSLPMWAGVPILAGAVAATSGKRLRGAWSRLLAYGFAATFGVAQLAGFAAASRRYTVGADGKLLYFVHPVWTGPVAPALVLVVAVVGIGTLARAVARTGFGPSSARVPDTAGPRALMARE